MELKAAFEAVRELAYRIWEERGRSEGRADQDWFEAERRLKGRRQADSELVVEEAAKGASTQRPNPPADALKDGRQAEIPKVGARDAPGG